MKKLSEFSNKEVKNLIVSLNAELKILSEDNEIKAILKEFATTRKREQEKNRMIFEIIPDIINILLVTNETSLWRILSAITQMSEDEVQELNNVKTIEVLVDFFSIKQYRELFSLAIK